MWLYSVGLSFLLTLQAFYEVTQDQHNFAVVDLGAALVINFIFLFLPSLINDNKP